MKRILKFLSSIKLAIILIIILAVASIVGTLLPQAPRGLDSAQYGEWLANVSGHIGSLTGLLDQLQGFKLYRSFWYLALILFFSVNIIVCTLTRLSAKWKRAVRPVVAGDPKTLLALKNKERIKKNVPLAAAQAAAEGRFKARRYKVRAEASGSRVSLLARKRIGGIFGSDVVHVGLLIIVAGGLVSALLSIRGNMQLREGEVQAAPGAAFSIRLDKFSMIYYDDARITDPEQRQVKSYISQVTVLEGAREVLSRAIEVNHPLNYKGYNFYQSSYGFDQGGQPEAAPVDLSFELKSFEGGRYEIWAKKASVPDFLKKVTLEIGERAVLDEAQGVAVSVIKYLPDFVLGEGNQPESRSDQPNNPAVQIEGFQGPERIFSGWLFAKYPDFAQMHAAGKTGGAAKPFSVLEAAKDPGVPLIWLGCLLVMAGLGLAFYWPTWEIKAVLEETKGQTEITLGGLAAKSREAFAVEFAAVAADLRSSS
jgi:cytochrome c biogenesis protein